MCSVYACTRERWFSQNDKVLHIQNGLWSARGDQNETYQPTDTSCVDVMWCDVIWWSWAYFICVSQNYFNGFSFVRVPHYVSVLLSQLHSFAAKKHFFLFYNFIITYFSLLSLLVFLFNRISVYHCIWPRSHLRS